MFGDVIEQRVGIYNVFEPLHDGCILSLYSIDKGFKCPVVVLCHDLVVGSGGHKLVSTLQVGLCCVPVQHLFKRHAQQCCRLAFKGDTVELFHFVGAFAGVDREAFLGIAPGVDRRQLDYSGGIGMAGSDEKCFSEENYNPSLRTNFKVCSSFHRGLGSISYHLYLGQPHTMARAPRLGGGRLEISSIENGASIRRPEYSLHREVFLCLSR